MCMYYFGRCKGDSKMASDCAGVGETTVDHWVDEFCDGVSLDDNSRAGQKRPADDTASPTSKGWPTKDAKHTEPGTGHQTPAQQTTAITDARPQQYTRPAGDMGPQPQQQGPTPPAPPTAQPARARGQRNNKKRRGCNGGQRPGGPAKHRDLDTAQPGP